MSTGIHGHGTTLSIGGTTVGNITSISGPDQSRDAIDISTMDSTNKWREYIPGMIDAGEVSVDLNFDGTTVSTLLQAQLTQTAQTILITFSDSDTATWSASGFITSLGHAIPFDDKVSQTVGMKFTGAATFSAS